MICCLNYRRTLPIDANVYGNVHGGTILKMIEDAGTIIATRYCNRATFRSEVSDDLKIETKFDWYFFLVLLLLNFDAVVSTF